MPTSKERIEDLSQQVQRMRIAIWALVLYAVVLSTVVWGVQKGLWMAIDASVNTYQARQQVEKLPCSSAVNENCEIFVQ